MAGVGMGELLRRWRPSSFLTAQLAFRCLADERPAFLDARWCVCSALRRSSGFLPLTLARRASMRFTTLDGPSR